MAYIAPRSLAESGRTIRNRFADTVGRVAKAKNSTVRLDRRKANAADCANGRIIMRPAKISQTIQQSDKASFSLERIDVNRL